MQLDKYTQTLIEKLTDADIEHKIISSIPMEGWHEVTAWEDGMIYMRLTLVVDEDDADIADTIRDGLDKECLSESDVEDMYSEMLDREGMVTIAGCEYAPSRILKEVDPIAYNCGLASYQDILERDGKIIV